MSASQPIPVVTDDDVVRLARRDYAAHADEVLALLAEYGLEAWHREVPRVRAAILRLGAGDVATLKIHLDYAKRDSRDVLVGAEYLGYGGLTLRESSPSAEDTQRAISNDWSSYREWFTR